MVIRRWRGRLIVVSRRLIVVSIPRRITTRTARRDGAIPRCVPAPVVTGGSLRLVRSLWQQQMSNARIAVPRQVVVVAPVARSVHRETSCHWCSIVANTRGTGIGMLQAWIEYWPVAGVLVGPVGSRTVPCCYRGLERYSRLERCSSIVADGGVSSSSLLRRRDTTAFPFLGSIATIGLWRHGTSRWASWFLVGHRKEEEGCFDRDRQKRSQRSKIVIAFW